MIYRFHLNENNLIKNDSLSKSIISDISSVCLYSSKKCSKSKELISQYYKISADNIVIFNGLEEAIFYTALFTRLKRDGAIITTEKTYKTINLSANFLDIPLIELPLFDNRIDINSLCFNVEKHIKSGDKISLCYICNPHNPTGTLIKGELIKLLNLAQKYNFLVFVDQAYIELLEKETITPPESLSYGNLILGRTFSKTYGLAGLRCGYVLTSNEEFLSWMSRVNEVLLFKENRMSVAAIKSVLFDKNPIEKTREMVQCYREKLERVLDNYDIRYIRSNTNFVLFQPPCSAEKFIDYARQKFNILLFNARELNWEGYVRITISSPDTVSIMEKMLFQMKREGLFNK